MNDQNLQSIWCLKPIPSVEGVPFSLHATFSSYTLMSELKTVTVASGPLEVHTKVSNNSKAQPICGFGRRKALGVNDVPLTSVTTISKILQDVCINDSNLHFFLTPATFVWSATVN